MKANKFIKSIISTSVKKKKKKATDDYKSDILPHKHWVVQEPSELISMAVGWTTVFPLELRYLCPKVPYILIPSCLADTNPW